jgi:hypothetical protein
MIAKTKTNDLYHFFNKYIKDKGHSMYTINPCYVTMQINLLIHIYCCCVTMQNEVMSALIHVVFAKGERFAQ